jgi:hypothetical protein
MAEWAQLVIDPSGYAVALLHGSGLSAGFPFPERASPHSVAVGQPETGHGVENPARELHLHPLTRQALMASSESQTVRSPRLRRPASYSGRLRIRYGDFAYWYWLRFGYFIGGDSGSGLHHHDALKSGAVHQRYRS